MGRARASLLCGGGARGNDLGELWLERRTWVMHVAESATSASERAQYRFPLGPGRPRGPVPSAQRLQRSEGVAPRGLGWRGGEPWRCQVATSAGRSQQAGGTAHQEAVDVGHGRQVWRVLGVGRAWEGGGGQTCACCLCEDGVSVAR